MKRLIVLTGDPSVTVPVLKAAVGTGAVHEVGLYDEILATIAAVSKRSLEYFVDPEAAFEPFPEGPVKADVKVLARYASKLGMRPVPAALGGKTFDTPAALLAFLIQDVGFVRWGTDFPVRVFNNDFAYRKKGFFVMTEADDHVEDLCANIGKDAVIIVNFQENGGLVDAQLKKVVDVVVQYDEPHDIESLTLKMLKEVDEIKELKKEKRNGRKQASNHV
jgi:hypothetical protein